MEIILQKEMFPISVMWTSITPAWDKTEFKFFIFTAILLLLCNITFVLVDL